MAVHELAVFPQYTLSSGQGRVGTRKWVLTGGEDVNAFVGRVCASHWPGDANTRPVMVQVGAVDEKLLIKDNTGGGPGSPLPQFKETLVVAQYQFLLFDTRWPQHITKPYHPPGTTIALRIRSSGQFLTMPPGAFMAVGNDKQVVFTTNENCRIVIPIAEYHITCDRLKAGQVPSWKHREGTVNDSAFLGESKETLLFDTAELDHSFAPALSPRLIPRFKLTIVLRSRDIPVGDKHFGWNHDYHNDHWVRIQVKENDTPYDRYPIDNFSGIFGNSGSASGASGASGSGSGSGSGG